MPYAGRGGAGNIEKAQQVPRPAAEQIDLEAANAGASLDASLDIARAMAESSRRQREPDAGGDEEGGARWYVSTGRGGAGNHHDPESFASTPSTHQQSGFGRRRETGRGAAAVAGAESNTDTDTMAQPLADLHNGNAALAAAPSEETTMSASEHASSTSPTSSPAHPPRTSSLQHAVSPGRLLGRGGAGNFEPNAIDATAATMTSPTSPTIPTSPAAKSTPGIMEKLRKAATSTAAERESAERASLIRAKAEQDVEKALSRPEKAYVIGADKSIAGREAVATVTILD